MRLGFTDAKKPNSYRLVNESADNYAANHKSTYEMLHDVMKGRIHVDQDSVWPQLKDPDDDLVKRCSQELKATCDEDICELKQTTSSTQKARSLNEEKYMYAFLSRIFGFVVASPLTPAHKTIGRFLHPSAMNCDEEANPYVIDSPQGTTDFQLEYVTAMTESNKTSRPRKYKDGFYEVKLKLANGQPSSDPNVERPFLLQRANYARLDIPAGAPPLFGMLVYGTHFYARIFERAGAWISPGDMRLDLENFVRVVHDLTCVLGASDIGQDPAVPLLEKPIESDCYVIKPVGEERNNWCTIVPPIWSSLSHFGRGTVVWKVAEYNVEMDGVVGSTMIMKASWRSARRNPESSLCRYIPAISMCHPEISISEFATGGDVYVEGGSPPEMHCVAEPSSDLEITASPVATDRKTLLTVPWERRPGQETVAEERASSILRRVIINRVGRPPWEYNDDKELARGFIAVLQTHKKLCEMNVLHRDISPGNILLAENPKLVDPGREGLLLDFEFARFGDEVGVERVGNDLKRTLGRTDARPNVKKTTRSLSGNDTGLQAPIAGTVQFMALDLLKVIVSQQYGPESRIEFKQKDYHDLESIIWVFAYIQLRKMLLIAKSKKKECESEKTMLEAWFKNAFGRIKLPEIRDQRRHLTPLEWIGDDTLQPFLAKHLSENLADVMGVIYRKMKRLFEQRQKGPLAVAERRIRDPEEAKRGEGNESELTHDYLIDLFRQVEQG